MTLVLAVASSCKTVQRIEIAVDGSAVVEVDVAVGPDDPLLAVYDADYEELVDLAREDESRFLEKVLAIDASDPLYETYDVEAGDDSIRLVRRFVVEHLEDLTVQPLVDDREGLPDPLALSPLMGGEAESSSDRVTLTADVVANLARTWECLFALDDASFLYDGSPDLGDMEAFRGSSVTLELVLPGRVLDHDAHDVDGNTVRWTWTVGREADPVVDVTWDPTGQPKDHGFDWWGRDQAIVFGFLAVGLVVLVVAGSMGLLGFTRKLDREGRRVTSRRWPRR